MDVAIVGGGIVGLACARELALRGVDVTILEAGPATAQGSTARANGGIRAQFATQANIACSVSSIAAYEELAARHPEVGLRQTGYLLMTGTAEGEARLRAGMTRQRAMGVDVRWLEPAEVADLAPQIRLGGLRGGAFHARDGVLDPAGAAGAIERDARDAGARIVTDAEVTEATRHGEAWDLRHAGGALRARTVVNAAGSDAREVAGLFGADVPVEPVRRNLALFLDASTAGLTPMLVDMDTGVLARREAGGAWVVAYADPSDRPGRDTRLDPRFLEALAARAPNRFPFLADLPVDPARCWAGLYPETPDHHAIIGPDPSVRGLIHAVGFGGHGVMHAPAAGLAVAELIVSGASTTIDVRALRPGRFADGDPVIEPNVF